MERARIFMAAALKLRAEGAAQLQADTATTTTEGVASIPMPPSSETSTTIEKKKTTSRKGEGRASRKEKNKRLYELYLIKYYCTL